MTRFATHLVCFVTWFCLPLPWFTATGLFCYSFSIFVQHFCWTFVLWFKQRTNKRKGYKIHVLRKRQYVEFLALMTSKVIFIKNIDFKYDAIDWLLQVILMAPRRYEKNWSVVHAWDEIVRHTHIAPNDLMYSESTCECEPALFQTFS